MSTPLITLMAPALDGGIGRNIINLSETFHSRGYRVQVLLDKVKGPYLGQLHPAIAIRSLLTSNDITGVPQASLYLMRERPAVVLTPNARQTVLMLRARKLSRSPVRIFANVHNTYSRLYAKLSNRKFTRRLTKLRVHYPRCDGIIAVSTGVAGDFCRLTGIPARRVTTIHNPVIGKDLQQLAAQAVTHPWFAPGEPPVIISVGRLDIAKNFPLLIAAFDRVRAALDSRLVIIGEGSQRPLLEQRIQSSPYARDIALLGHQTNPFAYMKRAAIFALSSSWEGFGNVLVEAMATGTPVVATDCPNGPREILDSGRLGRLVPMDDSGALAKAIIETLHSPIAAETLRQATIPYHADAVAQHYLQTFKLDAASPAADYV